MSVFDDATDTPCPVCLQIAKDGMIQPRAVMPLPKFPALLRSNGRPCCRDCAATDAIMRMGAHSDFNAARLCVANERVAGLTMPKGMMEHMGLVKMGVMRPCSIDDLDARHDWLESHGIPDTVSCEAF